MYTCTAVFVHHDKQAVYRAFSVTGFWPSLPTDPTAFYVPAMCIVVSIVRISAPRWQGVNTCNNNKGRNSTTATNTQIIIILCQLI